MEVEWIVLADSAEVINSKLYALGAGWEVVNLGALPAIHTFAIAVVFKVPWNGTNQAHDLEVCLLDPDGIELLKIDGQLEVGRPPGMNPGSAQRLPVSFTVSHQFDKPGPYSVVARVDEQIGKPSADETRVPFVVAAPQSPSIMNR